MDFYNNILNKIKVFKALPIELLGVLAVIVVTVIFLLIVIKLIKTIREEMALSKEYKERFNSLKSTMEDKEEKKVLEILMKINKLSQMEWPKYKENKKEIFNDVGSYLSILEGLKNKTIFNKKDSDIYLYMSNDKWDKHIIEKAQHEQLQDNQDKINKALNSLESDEEKKKGFYYNDAGFLSLSQIESQWAEALQLYTDVESEINEALSAISDAETTETLDLVTNNKAISFLSSMNNSDAQDEVRDIKPAIAKLVEHLEKIKVELKNDKDQFHISNFSDNTDLIIDMVFDFSFDFSSLFSLSALSDAEDDVIIVKNKVEPVGLMIKEKFNKAQESKKHYFNGLP